MKISNFKPLFVLGRAMNDEDKKKSIIKCIESKQELYSPVEVKDLILLVEVTIPSTNPNELNRLFKTKEKFEFKGIYFVQLPIPLGSDNGYEEGFIYSFKDPFV
jgi:hypothetical protein